MKLLDLMFRSSRRANVDRYYLFQVRGWGLFLHHIHHDEQEGVFHSHPWSWVSLVFGQYDDHRLSGAARRVRGLNWCAAGAPHRVTLPRGPVWTLRLHAPRACAWAVFGSNGGVLEVEPWTGTDNLERRKYA